MDKPRRATYAVEFYRQENLEKFKKDFPDLSEKDLHKKMTDAYSELKKEEK
jgi:hypothetical protein